MSEGDPRRKRKAGWARRWHRWIGAVFALPLLWLCGTGLLLQHQDDLGLRDKEVRSGWLLKRYGQIPEGAPRSATAGRFTVSEWGGVLFLDDTMLEEGGALVGAVARPAEVVVATKEKLLVYDAQGRFVDRLGEESLPAVPIERVGLWETDGLRVEAGGKVYAISADYLEHEEADGEERVKWSVVGDGAASRPELQAALAAGAGFTWGRVVTDLHSGSLFGLPGRLLVDLSGIAVIVLTLFGIRLLFKPSARKS